MPPTTLGSAAAAMTMGPRKRGLGVWLGIGAIVVVAGVIAVVVAMPDRRSPGPDGSGGSGGEGSDGIVAGLGDAGALVPPDAAEIAAVSRDAAVVGFDAAVSDSEKSDLATVEMEIAAQFNEEGKKLMYAGDHEQARRSFSQAIARDPQAKYFVNLATADLQLGYLGAAADALREALQQSPTSEQAYKAKKLFGIIAKEAKKQGITLNPPISPAELGTGSQEVLTADPRQPSKPAEDPTQAAIAARLFDEGKQLLYADKYGEAARKFQDAVARVPEPKYFVGLCAARLQTGELDLALTACRAVAQNKPNPDVQARANKLIAKIEDEARKQGLELHGP